MAKARIVYVVDDKQLKEVQKELTQIKKQNKGVADSFGDQNKEIKKNKTSLVDLKGTIAGLGIAGLVAGGIAAFAKLNEQINKNRKEVALLTKETGLGLDLVTAKIQATAKVFDKDFNEILRAANTLSNEFSISMTEALDEINDGFTRGLDVNGEYLDTLKEYSTFIKEAGLNTKQFNVLIQQQVQQGIFSDKGIDAIKEAVLSIREMTPVTRDAIKAIGLDTDKLTKDIQSGAVTYFEVVQQIAAKTRELADPIKTGAILADVFKGAGEDAGNFIFTLDSVGDSYAEVTEEQQKYIDKQKDLIEATEATEKALLSLTSSTQGVGTSIALLWEKVKAGTLAGLNETINLFISSEKQVETFRQSIEGLNKGTLSVVFDGLIEQNKELNKELEKSNEIIAKGGSSPKRAFIIEDLATLDEKIQLVSSSMLALTNQEIAEAEAAKLAALSAEELAKAKQLQADASDKARQASQSDTQELESIAPDPQFNIGDQTLANEQKLQEDLAQIKENQRELDLEANQASLDLKHEQEVEAAQLKEELTTNSLNALSEIAGSFAQLKIDQIGQELTALEFARNRELELAEGNKTKEAQINKKFDEEKKKLQREQVVAEKASALFSIAINTGVAILKTAAQLGFPAAIPFVAIAAALGIAQSAFVLAQKPPEFAEGVLRLQGPGTRTSDSIDARLSKDETVLSAQTTDDYYPAVKAIFNREISPDILNNMVMHRDTSPVINDYDKLAQAVMNQPQKNIYMDQNGFTQHLVNRGRTIQKKESKFKM